MEPTDKGYRLSSGREFSANGGLVSIARNADGTLVTGSREFRVTGLQNTDEQHGRRFYDDVLERTRALPTVISAAWAFPVPFDTYGRGVSLYVEGVQTNSEDGTLGVNASFVSEDFIPALGLRLEAGRELTVADSANAPLAMVVSRRLATRLWPGRDPIGQHARRGGASGPEITVVGVVGDAKFETLGPSSDARAYMPLRQRYRDLLREEVANTVASPAEVEDELRYLLTVLSA